MDTLKKAYAHSRKRGLRFSTKVNHNFTIIHQDFFFFKWYNLDFVYLNLVWFGF